MRLIALPIAVAVVLAVFYGFATMLRHNSMFFPERYPVGASWETRAEEVQFTSRDGVMLHGWLFSAGQPLILWFHGNGGNITERAPMAEELARRGLSVLLFDYRGYGKSDGTPTEEALYDDAEAAYAFAATRSKDIVLYGESLGGPYAAWVAKHHHVHCVVIENSFPSLREMGNAVYPPLGWFAPRAMNTVGWLNDAHVPVLVMHGRRDDVIPFALGQRLFEKLRGRKEMLVSDTAGHCEIPSVEGSRYYDTVVRFVKSPP